MINTKKWYWVLQEFMQQASIALRALWKYYKLLAVGILIILIGIIVAYILHDTFILVYLTSGLSIITLLSIGMVAYFEKEKGIKFP